MYDARVDYNGNSSTSLHRPQQAFGPPHSNPISLTRIMWPEWQIVSEACEPLVFGAFNHKFVHAFSSGNHDRERDRSLSLATRLASPRALLTYVVSRTGFAPPAPAQEKSLWMTPSAKDGWNFDIAIKENDGERMASGPLFPSHGWKCTCFIYRRQVCWDFHLGRWCPRK